MEKAHAAGDAAVNRERIACFVTRAGESGKPSAHGLNGVLPRPLACRRLVTGAIGLVDVGNFGHQRVVGVRVSQHGAD